jgi:hypothetical protein
VIVLNTAVHMHQLLGSIDTPNHLPHLLAFCFLNFSQCILFFLLHPSYLQRRDLGRGDFDVDLYDAFLWGYLVFQHPQIRLDLLRVSLSFHPVYAVD